MEGFGRYKSMKDWNIKITKVCYKHHSISEVAEIVEKQQQQGSIFNFKLLYGECSYTDKQVMKVYIINFPILLIGYVPPEYERIVCRYLKEKKDFYIQCKKDYSGVYSFFLTCDCDKPSNNLIFHDNSESNKISYKLNMSNEFVYWTPTGTKYHKKNCRHFRKNNNLCKGEIEEALFLGKEPCSSCYAFKSKEEILSSASNVNELISLNESNQNKIRWLYYKYPNELKKVFHVRKSIEEKPSTAEFIEQEICDCFSASSINSLSFNSKECLRGYFSLYGITTDFLDRLEKKNIVKTEQNVANEKQNIVNSEQIVKPKQIIQKNETSKTAVQSSIRVFLCLLLFVSAVGTSLCLSTNANSMMEKIKDLTLPTCDGTSVTKNCKYEGVKYKIYQYYPEVEEKSHFETTYTYENYEDSCTLCVDGTWSPTCATGRGACSWHGGVQEYDATRIKTKKIEHKNKVIDESYQKAYVHKIKA